MTQPKKGDLQVWWVPQVPGKSFDIPVSSAEEGAKILNILAEYDAFQFINNIKPDYCNSGGLSEFDGEEWFDWQDLDTYEEDPQEKYPQSSLGWCSKLNA